MSKKLLVSVLIVVIIVASGSTYYWYYTYGPGAKQVVRVGYMIALSHAPLFIGIEKGYFKEQGLELEATSFLSIVTMLPPLAAGELDVVLGGVDAGLFNSLAQGFAMKVVCDKGAMPPGYGYSICMIRKALYDDGTIREPSDLKGKKIAYMGAGTAGHLQILKLLEQAGLTDKDVELVLMATPDMVTAFKTGAIDAGIVLEPLATQAEEEGWAVKWKTGDQIYPNMQNAVDLYGEKFMKERPDAAKRFMIAWIKAVRDYMNGINQQWLLDILEKWTKVPASRIKKTIWAYINPNGYPNITNILEQQDYWYKRGLVSQKVTNETIFDMTYVDEALKVLGKV